MEMSVVLQAEIRQHLRNHGISDKHLEICLRAITKDLNRLARYTPQNAEELAAMKNTIRVAAMEKHLNMLQSTKQAPTPKARGGPSNDDDGPKEIANNRLTTGISATRHNLYLAMRRANTAW